jgi:hypothetical protein
MMPSSSKKQHNLMAAVANNPAFAKKAGIPQSVGEDFLSADKGKKFSSGSRADSQAINRPKTNQGKSELFSKGGTMATKKPNPFMAMMAKKKSMSADAPASPMPPGMKKGGMKKMATGGSVDVGMSTSMGKVRSAAPSKDGVAAKGKTKGKQIVMSGNKGMKSGGMTKKYC